MEVDLRALLPCHGLDKLWKWKCVYWCKYMYE
jgi:hypothetical protein